METGPYANPAQAALALRRALVGDPGNRTFTLGLMELYRQLGRLDEARSLGEGRLATDPDDVGLLDLLEMVYAEAGESEPLLALLRTRSLEAERAMAAGTHATSAGQFETALKAFERGLELRPGDWEGWLSFCNVLLHSHRLAEAVERAAWLYAQPVLDEGLRAKAGFLQGVGLLLQGRLAQGFPWLECRFGMNGKPGLVDLPLDPWRGEDVAGMTLLLQAEEGFGDVFMMARYAAVLAGRGATVLLRPQPRTQELMATCRGLAGIAEGEMVLPEGTLQAPILSLPALCGTDLDSIPGGAPYLAVPRRVPSRETIDACLAMAPEARRIGLVWAGNPGHALDRERSMPPEMLDLLADVPGCAWVDMMVQDGPRPSLPLLPLGKLLTDFSDTAYALSRLDGLITVDSSPAHLAGALGRPVWLALAWLPDWRWMMDRRDTPWYPTVELWRQASRGDWAGVVLAMKERLLRQAEGFHVL